METTRSFVLSFGELLWDLLPGGKVLGGAPANLAVRLRSLGVPTFLVSRVGRDRLGEEAIGQLRTLGLDSSFIQRDQMHPTGTVDVTIDGAGKPTFSINKATAYDFIELNVELLTAAAHASVICFGTLVQRSSSTQNTLYAVLTAGARAMKMLDVNLRRECYTRENVALSLQYADILKLNEEEIFEIASLFSIKSRSIEGIAANMISRFDLESILVTRGENGVYGRTAAGYEVTVPGVSVPVVDTIGSGDAFTAGFIGSLLHGRSFRSCCDYGNRLGALVATTRGALAPINLGDMDRLHETGRVANA